jgi:uncharacterized protein with HEPN domain
MSEIRNINLFIQDVLSSIEKIEAYILNITSAKQLKNNSQVNDAIMMNFIIIGEAVKNIYDLVREDYPDVEWKEIMAMRNILVHEYWGIDENVVWNTVKNDLPILKDIIIRIKNSIK